MATEAEIKDAIQEFLETRVQRYLSRTTKAARSNYVLVLLLNFLAFAPLAATSAIAAIDPDEAWGKITLIILPMVSGLAGGLLLKLNLVMLWKGRQKASINLRNLYDDTKRQLVLAKDAEELAAIYTQVIVEFQVIEQSLSRNISRAMKPIYTQGSGPDGGPDTETINFQPTAFIGPQGNPNHKNSGDGNS